MSRSRDGRRGGWGVRPVQTRRSLVVVDGWGPLAEEVVAQLRRCDVEVHGGLHAADGAELAMRSWGSAPHVVVVVAEGRAPDWAAAPWQARGIPHVVVVVDHDAVTVGPLVLPGRSACLSCVAASRPASLSSALRPVPLEGVVLAAAVTSVTVLATLRGEECLAGISTEISLDKMAVTHRVWQARLDCSCTSASTRASAAGSPTARTRTRW